MASTHAQYPPQSLYANQPSSASAAPSWPSSNPDIFQMDSDDMVFNQPIIQQTTLDPTSSHLGSQNTLGITDNSALGSSTTNMTSNTFLASVENPNESLGLQVPSTRQMPNTLTLVHSGSRPSLHLDVPSPSNSDFSHSPLSAGHVVRTTGSLGLDLDAPLPDRGYNLLNHDAFGSYDSPHSFPHSRDHSPARSPYGGSPYPPSSPNHSAAASLAGGSPFPFSNSPRNIPLPLSGRQTPLLDTRDIPGQSPMSNGDQPSPSPTREGVGKIRGRVPHSLVQTGFAPYPQPASAPPDRSYASIAQGVSPLPPFETEVEAPKVKGSQYRRHKVQLSQSAHPDIAPHHSPFSNEGLQLAGHGPSYAGGSGGGRRPTDVNNRFTRNSTGGAGARRPSDAHGSSPYAQPNALPSSVGQGAGMAMPHRMHGSAGSAHGLGLNTNIHSASYTSNDLNFALSNDVNQNVNFGANAGLGLPVIETASNLGSEQGLTAEDNEFRFDPLHSQQFLQPSAMPLAGNLNPATSLQGHSAAQALNFLVQSQSQPQPQPYPQSQSNAAALWSPLSADNEEHPPPSPSVFSPSGISPVGTGSHPHSPWTSHPASPRLQPMPTQHQVQIPGIPGNLGGVSGSTDFSGMPTGNEDPLFNMDPTSTSSDKANANEAAGLGAEAQPQPSYTLEQINSILFSVTGLERQEPSDSMRANNSNIGDANNLGPTLGAVGGAGAGIDPTMSALTPMEQYRIDGAAADLGYINNLIGDVPIPRPMGTPLPYMQTLPPSQVQGQPTMPGTASSSAFPDFGSQEVPPSPKPGTQLPWGGDGQLRSNNWDQFMQQQELQIQPQSQLQQVNQGQIPLNLQDPNLFAVSQPPQSATVQPTLNIPQPQHNNPRQVQGRPRAFSSTSDRSHSSNPTTLFRNRSEKAHQAHRRFASHIPGTSQTPEIMVTQHEHGPHAPSAPPFMQAHQHAPHQLPGQNQQYQQQQGPATAPAYVNMQQVYPQNVGPMNLYQNQNISATGSAPQLYHPQHPMPQIPHTVSYPPPNAPDVTYQTGFPQTGPTKDEYSDISDISGGGQDIYFANPSDPTAGTGLARNTSNSMSKQQQPGQRAKVDDHLLHNAFKPESKHPDPALRKLLDIILESAFYHEETLEPMQGTPEAEFIFAQVRLFAPNDPRFAPKPGDPSGSGSNMIGYGGANDYNDGLGAQKDAQSIYNLFQENNACLICCNKQTDRNARALAHIRSDLGHRPYHCTKEKMGCKKCSKTDHPRKFFSHNLLEDHISGQTKKQQCTQCSTFIRRGGMRRHWQAKHPELKFTGRDGED